MKNILIINGPNMNLIGMREKEVYGASTYSDLTRLCECTCEALGVSCKLFQSNHEGDIVDEIQKAYGVYDGIVINPAAYTHTSIAILDALKAVAIPAVEVHMTDISRRESFRRQSYVGLYCERSVIGHGIDGYREAIEYLASR